MLSSIKIINNEIKKIENALYAVHSSVSERIIAKCLIERWKNKQTLPKITQLAQKLALAEGNISKFIKKNNMEKYQVLTFIFKLNATAIIETDAMPIDFSKIEKTKELILKSNNILLVGTGNSGLIAKSFYTRLILQGVRAIFLEGKPDQIKMMNKMDANNDLIICFSFSMSHQWTNNLLRSNKKTIYFTAQSLVENEQKIVFSPYLTETYKYRYVDSKTLSYINEQLDKIMQSIKATLRIKQSKKVIKNDF